jgi:glycosyltransferase involved in cell wall biosynthesis
VIERALGRFRTDRLVAVSASEREELERLRYVSPERLVQVDCGIDGAEVRRAASLPPAVPLPAAPLVVAAGRLNAQKDPLFLVRVARELAPEVPELRFLWIGDGDLRPAVEAAVRDAGLAGRWTITGWLANPFPLIAGATVFALSSRYESFGYVTLEAMALGRPVVSTHITGSRDLVVPGESGHLVPLDDVRGFADAVARVVRDPGHAAALGRAAAARAEHFSKRRMAEEMLAVYRSVGGRAAP